MSEDIFEKLFGKAPEEGYEFKDTKVELVDNERFKGFVIKWLASGIGFGEVWVGWDLKGCELSKKGFYSDTEFMSEEFINALITHVSPEIAKIIIKSDRSDEQRNS
jgi:hypothetical protein